MSIVCGLILFLYIPTCAYNNLYNTCSLLQCWGKYSYFYYCLIKTVCIRELPFVVISL